MRGGRSEVRKGGGLAGTSESRMDRFLFFVFDVPLDVRLVAFDVCIVMVRASQICSNNGRVVRKEPAGVGRSPRK